MGNVQATPTSAQATRSLSRPGGFGRQQHHGPGNRQRRRAGRGRHNLTLTAGTNLVSATIAISGGPVDAGASGWPP